MDYLVKDQKLELKYVSGKGAWTYHLCIPNTKQIKGKWGEIKVSGYIDNYKIESKNLAPTKNEYKMLAVNGEIRKAINKSGGDFVTVTLYLVENNAQLTENQIIATFTDAEVLLQFKNLTPHQQQQIIAEILAQKTEENQIKQIIKHIDKLAFS